ncbi:cancer/testis antigen 55-like [Tupaia chinensis]|uniref:cancer/testis antigen 55-like n=1 Tax=Tupaia chinensis TaxID=246437 RepID=UPI000FFBC479|nr:cancer/testis antigen 55-like [Tupaia chinensis]
MIRLLRRATACFRRRVDHAQEQYPQHMRPLQGDTKLKTVQGVVTSFCSDYGLINESIHFKSDVVTGNTPLKVGQKVTAIVEEDEISHGLKAIKCPGQSGDIGAMIRLLRRATACFRRRVDHAQEQYPQHMRPLQGDTKLKTVQGVVTSFCSDYGLINESIHFKSDVVTGNTPLKVGQKVTAIVEEDEISHGLKAIKVDTTTGHCDGLELSEPRIRVLVGCISSIKKNIVYINKKTYFPLNNVSEGYMPYKGDWIEVEYSIPPGTSNIRAHSVKPVNCSHMEEVCIFSLNGRNGVIDDTIFFTLDSLKLPDGYVPQKYDIVNVDVVESTQSCCIWRAVSMSPLHM